MAVPGAKPVADRSSVRRNNSETSTLDWYEVPDVPFRDAPPLPPRTLANPAEAGTAGLLDRWPDATMRWYRAVSRMPHAARWRDADWEFVWATAESHARFCEGWKGHTGAELRTREKQLGINDDARRDLRIRYVDPDEWQQRQDRKRRDTAARANSAGGGASVVDLDDFRDL